FTSRREQLTIRTELDVSRDLHVSGKISRKPVRCAIKARPCAGNNACTAKGASAGAKPANGLHASASISGAAVAAPCKYAAASITEPRPAPEPTQPDAAVSVPRRTTESGNTPPAKARVAIPAKCKHSIPTITVIANNEDCLAHTCQRERHRN